MATVEREEEFVSLDLPEEFEGLEGLLGADLRAVVGMIAQRAHERLYLTRREYRQLQTDLWNGLAEVLNAAAAPLTVRNR